MPDVLTGSVEGTEADGDSEKALASPVLGGGDASLSDGVSLAGNSGLESDRETGLLPTC